MAYSSTGGFGNGAPPITGPSSPAQHRPSTDVLGSSVSTSGFGSGGLVPVGEDAHVDDGETVDSLMSKLALEKRIQYGAEKMLDVVESRNGDGDQDKVKLRITAQLEQATEHIKSLETKLERLRGGSTSFQPPRRRGPQRLNTGTTLAAASSAAATFGTSAGSSYLSGGPSRGGRHGSHGSNMTPERDRIREGYSISGTPSTSRMDDAASVTASSLGAEESGRAFGQSRSMEVLADSDSEGSENEELDNDGEEDENIAVMRETVGITLRRLHELAHPSSGRKGKAPEHGDEAWDCLTKLAELFKQTPSLIKHVDISDLVHSVLPYLADDTTTRRRAATYRLLRYALDRMAWGRYVSAGLQWIIIRTFTRDSKAVHEREQALRLLRAVIVLPPFTSREIRRLEREPLKLDPIPDGVVALLKHRVPLQEAMVRAIVSAAENQDDAMRTVCMETLVEIALLDLRCLIRANAFRIVLNSFKDGPLELGLGVTGLLMYLINRPETRECMIPGSDLEMVLIGLTEEHGKVPLRQMQRHLDKLDHCVRNVGMLLGTWSGLLYLCMDNSRAIKSLISSLHVPMTEMRNALLDLFFSAFRIKAPSWTSAFLDGRRLTVYNRNVDAATYLQEVGEEDEVPPSLTLVDHYVSFLLAVFIEAGLLDALVALVQDNDCEQGVRRKATLLLGEILQLANRILPLPYAAQIQALPHLFSGVTEFAKPSERNAALSALSSIDSLFRNNRKSAQAQPPNQHHKLGPSMVTESLQRSQRQVQQVKLRLGLQVDDKQLQQMISDSGVLISRDHTKWNYDVIMDLIQGPLLNPRRLDEVLRATKFIRRLFSFLHPFNNRFSTILRTRPNHKWVRMACSLITTLLINPEGQRVLSEDKLLRQIVECLTELDQYAGQPSSQPVFARDRLESTLTYGYFEMIGTLSRDTAGIKLLEKFKFFTCFYHLCELRSREDIIKLIIECFDYSIDAHQRIVLSKALTSNYMETRLYATHHLGRLLHEFPEITDWALQLLVTQLYDTAIEVCEIAVMYLEEACSDPDNLEKVVSLRPSLEHLGSIVDNLHLRFMSTSAGFSYLLHAHYIDQELESWLTEGNLLYVVEVETFVTKTIRPMSRDSTDEFWAYEGTAPTHFFGELCKTPEGCQYLREKGVVSTLAEDVKQNGMESENGPQLTSVKSALWALGNIGSTEGGLAFLEDEEIIEVIIEIAEQSPMLTMKGTCFFVLGLISSTLMGAEILEEYGWVSTRTSMGQTTGLCLPNNLSRFAHIDPWTPEMVPSLTPPLPALSGLEGEVVHMISNLSNYVLAGTAMNNLKRVRTRHPRLFHSVTFFHRVMRMVSVNHFQAPVRRFILDLFDVKLGPGTLARMSHLEQASYQQGQSQAAETNAPDVAKEDPQPKRAAVVEGDQVENGRPRSVSSPGPERPDRTSPRARGMTISNSSVVPLSHTLRHDQGNEPEQKPGSADSVGLS